MLIAANFHYIRESYATPYPAFFGTTPEKFRHQLEKMAQWGEFIGNDELSDCLLNGKPIQGNKWIITFDDGLNEQIKYALPILESMGIPAVFYVNTLPLVEEKVLNVHKIHLVRSQMAPEVLTAFIQKEVQGHNIQINQEEVQKLGILHYKYDDAITAELKYLLNFILPTELLESVINTCFLELFEEAKMCSSMYMDSKDVLLLANKNLLGSHSHEHKPIGTLDPKEQMEQIKKSADILSQITGRVPESFSYPYGSKEAVYGLENALQLCGFSNAFTMDRGKNPDIIKAPYLLSRFDNNDLPGGKSWKFGTNNPFEILNYGQYQN